MNTIIMCTHFIHPPASGCTHLSGPLGSLRVSKPCAMCNGVSGIAEVYNSVNAYVVLLSCNRVQHERMWFLVMLYSAACSVVSRNKHWRVCRWWWWSACACGMRMCATCAGGTAVLMVRSGWNDTAMALQRYKQVRACVICRCMVYRCVICRCRCARVARCSVARHIAVWRSAVWRGILQFGGVRWEIRLFWCASAHTFTLSSRASVVTGTL
jgi:hypothetical protein